MMDKKKWHERFVSLKEFESYQENWDGYGAPPLDEGIIDLTRRIMVLLENADAHVVPAANGHIQIEWELGDEYLEMEISGSEDLTIMYNDSARKVCTEKERALQEEKEVK